MIHINTYDAEGSLELENAARMGEAMLAQGERYDYAADEVARRFYMLRSGAFLFWHAALPEVARPVFPWTGEGAVPVGVRLCGRAEWAIVRIDDSIGPFPAEPAFGSPEAVEQARERVLDHAAGRARRESAPMAVFERIVDGVPEHATLHASSVHLFPEVDGWARIATVDQRVELLDDQVLPPAFCLLEIHPGGEREVCRVPASEVRSRLEELRRTTRAAFVVEQAGRRWSWEEVFGARRPASAEPDIEPEPLFLPYPLPVDQLCALWVDEAPRFGAVAQAFPESLRKRRFVASFWAPEVFFSWPWPLFGESECWYSTDYRGSGATRTGLDHCVSRYIELCGHLSEAEYFWSPELPEVARGC